MEQAYVMGRPGDERRRTPMRLGNSWKECQLPFWDELFFSDKLAENLLPSAIKKGSGCPLPLSVVILVRVLV